MDTNTSTIMVLSFKNGNDFASQTKASTTCTIKISCKTDQSGYRQMIFYALIADVNVIWFDEILLTRMQVRGQGQENNNFLVLETSRTK